MTRGRVYKLSLAGCGYSNTTCYRLMMSPVLGVVLLTVALSGGAIAFNPIGEEASSHVSITATALLKKVRETCRAVAESSGHEFNPTGNSPEELVQACLGPKATGVVSAVKFRSALNEIYIGNRLVDCDFDNSPPHHFNNEAFLEGRALITEGVASIKANIRNQNFQAARETLGRVLHILQDFYSHSNWVELGFTEPYINLIRPDLPLENLAERDVATCSDCASGTCPNPILPNILQEKKLTSGYMGIFSEAKPKGKCSHGGPVDLTSTVVPRGGINKDERRPDNVAFYTAAVNLATSASLQLLEDIRGAAGDNDFLRMVGIDRASVVCFVVDTTGSMSDDIAVVRRLINQIIDTKKGTQDEPSEYILVPFNDPTFGPITRTPDGDVMKGKVSAISVSGGGDYPEMCLSGLQLALTGAPASSQIYVFTDATAKDIALMDTILALIMSTKSTVSFLMTGPSGRRRRSLKAATFNDYKELALASGGQAIEVSKSQLHLATDMILDTTTSALVTVFQRSRSAGTGTGFPFVLDGSLTDVTLYITGSGILFTLTNPFGVTQRQSEASGHLGTIQAVGNLWRIRLNAAKLPGTWQISISTSHPYTFKVTGQSVTTFIYDFVEICRGSHPGYGVITGRPNAGHPANLLLSVMGEKGPDSVSIDNVGLGMDGGAISSGTLIGMGNGDILAIVDSVPMGEFVVMVKGTDLVSGRSFQRQSTTHISVSTVTIKAAVDRSLEPGKTFTLPFSVMTQGSGGTYTINAKNDRGFAMTSPSSITLTSGEYANATLTITPPGSTASGTIVTLTIDAKSSSGADSNYAVLRLSIVSKITDFVPPLCNIVSVQAENCPEDPSQCEPFSWELSANLTDGTGTGIDRITLSQGDGHLQITDLDAPLIHATYKASCCSQTVELIAVDKVGNVGKCYHSIDFVSPLCNIVSVQAENCPEDVSQCEPFSWELSANLTDGIGTGIERITLSQGDGDLQITDLDVPLIHATYNASCCSQTVELIAVDKVGNVGKCYHSIDFVSPLCNIVSVQAENCPEDPSQCEAFSWELSANLTDGIGTGVKSIKLHHGDGTLQHTSLDVPLIRATYNASCCSQTVELIAVDKVGNVGKCYHSIDFVSPLCNIVSVQAENCPEDVSQCEPFSWELSANLTDGIGTGIDSIKLHQGDGTLQHTSLDVPLIHATYNASCCSQTVGLIAVDKVGNVGKCYHSIDFVSPLCNIISVQAENCPEDPSQCEPFSWELSANLTDGIGTGIEKITLSQGDGDLQITDLDVPLIHATYNASCCSQTVELIAVDKVGNVGKCYHSIDFVSPLCNIVSVQAENCPEDVSQCEAFSWELSANLTDGIGTGIDSIKLHQGDGTLQHTSLDVPLIHATYNASCCSQTVEIIAVDKVGNVGKCYHSIDFVSPLCKIVSVQAENCPEDPSQCEPFSWELSANLTDGIGNGIERITLSQGDGDLQITDLDVPLIHATYNASCCSQTVELIAVDKVGNVGKCYHSIDFVSPLCNIISVQAENCPEDVSQCEAFGWELSANLTDGIGTGIERIVLSQGDGTLQHTSLDALSIQATYTSSCCSQIAELIAVDKVGNEGRCYHSIARPDPVRPLCTTVGKLKNPKPNPDHRLYLNMKYSAGSSEKTSLNLEVSVED